MPCLRSASVLVACLLHWNREGGEAEIGFLAVSGAVPLFRGGVQFESELSIRHVVIA